MIQMITRKKRSGSWTCCGYSERIRTADPQIRNRTCILLINDLEAVCLMKCLTIGLVNLAAPPPPEHSRPFFGRKSLKHGHALGREGKSGSAEWEKPRSLAFS